jgi:hypothetical protein
MQTRLNQVLHKRYKINVEKRKVIAGLREPIKQNKPLIIAYITIVVLCASTFILSLYFKDLTYILSASASTPWGIVTSVFVHGGGLNHLIGNLLGLFFYFAFFVAIRFFDINNRIIRARLFLGIIFFAGLFSNLLWMILMPQSHSSGLSGVVYASEGIILTLSLLNALTFPKMRKPFTKENKRSFYIWSLNTLIFLSIFGSIVSDPAVFLNIAPNVNFFVHCISFYIAFAFSLIHNFTKTNLQVTILTAKQVLSKQP